MRLLEPRSEDASLLHPVRLDRAQPVKPVKLPDNDTIWTASADTLAPGKPVTLSWDNGDGLTFEIELSVDDNYMFSVAPDGEERHRRSR